MKRGIVNMIQKPNVRLPGRKYQTNPIQKITFEEIESKDDADLVLRFERYCPQIIRSTGPIC